MNILQWNGQDLIGHISVVLCTLRLDHNRIATGSLDKTIRIWKDYKLFKVLNGHSDQINQIQLFNKDYMLSCSDDNTIFLWDLNTYIAIKKFTEHTDSVTSILSVDKQIASQYQFQFKDIYRYGMFISASSDQKIKVWVDNGYNKSNRSIITLNQHTTPIKCLSLIEGQTTIYQDNFLDMFQFQLQKINDEMQANQINLFENQNSHSESGSNSNNQSIQQKQSLHHHHYCINSNKKVSQIYLISGGNSSEIFIWCLQDFKLLKKLQGQNAIISSILVNNIHKKIIVSCFD